MLKIMENCWYCYYIEYFSRPDLTGSLKSLTSGSNSMKKI